MSLKKINQLFNFEKGVLQSSKCIEGEYDFITAAADWKTHNEYSHYCEALIFAAAASGSLGRTHYVNGKFISSDLCFILTPKDPEKLPVDLKFYHIIFNLYKNEIVAATKAGTSKEAIGLKVFGEYELPYFDITLQNKVKAEFGKAEKLKNSLFDEYSYQLTLLDNLNQAILQEAVKGKLVQQDPKDEPASELLKRILALSLSKGKQKKPLLPIKPEEIPFEIPESWVWCRLGDIANHSLG
jgi:type I restriction enzyme S subunit